MPFMRNSQNRRGPCDADPSRLDQLIQQHSEHRAMQLRRATRIVELRLHSALAKDVQWQELRRQESRLKHVIHHARLSITKKKQKLRRLRRDFKLTNVARLSSQRSEQKAVNELEQLCRSKAGRIAETLEKIRLELGWPPADGM